MNLQQTARRPGVGRAPLLVAATFLVVMIGTTLPTPLYPLYPLYEQRVGFGGLMVTVIYATYAVGVAAALVLFGNLSDRIGRRPVLVAGLAAALLSGLLFVVQGTLLPDSLAPLFAGRFLSGISAGLFTGTATAAIIDLTAPERRPRAGLVAAVVNMLGLGLGPLLAGALAEWAPAPLTLPFLVHLVLLVVVGLVLLAVPEPVTDRRPFALTLLRWDVPQEVRGTFVRAATAGFAGFAVLGLFTAVSPSVVVQVLHRPDHLLIGVVASLMLGASAIGQVASTSVAERVALPVGCAGLLAGVLLVGTSIAVGSLTVLCLGAVVAGLGQGMSFRAGLSAVGSAAPPERRGGVTASFFLILYVAISIPVIGVGAAAQAVGLVLAGTVFSGLVAVLTAVALVGILRAEAPRE
ncbi:MAG: MFS transporter [Pseudonocardia sp.]|nr:MFS transporter [Pseudonocardia sp.]